jgi:fumarate reductase subunit D
MNKDTLEKYNNIDWRGLLREDRGDFSLEEIKDNLARIKTTFDYLIKKSEEGDVSSTYINTLNSQLGNFLSGPVRTIQSYANDSEKQRVIQQIQNTEETIVNNLQKYFSYFEFVDIEKDSKTEYRQKIGELDKYIVELRKKSEGLNKEVIEKERTIYSKEFKDASNLNKKMAMWSALFLITIAIVVIFIGFSFTDVSVNENFTLIEKISSYFTDKSFLGRVIILTVLFYVLNTTLRFFNAQMHQFSLNRHRHNAINSHKDLLELAKPNANNYQEVYNAMLSTLTSAIFDASDTGYINKKSGSDTKSPLIGQQIIDVTKGGE